MKEHKFKIGDLVQHKTIAWSGKIKKYVLSEMTGYLYVNLEDDTIDVETEWELVSKLSEVLE